MKKSRKVEMQKSRKVEKQTIIKVEKLKSRKVKNVYIKQYNKKTYQSVQNYPNMS